MMEIDALFVLCSLRIVKILVIFIHSLDCSYLVQVVLQIDDQNISNLSISIFEILPLYDRKDLKSEHQGSTTGMSYPIHHYNELDN